MCQVLHLNPIRQSLTTMPSSKFNDYSQCTDEETELREVKWFAQGHTAGKQQMGMELQCWSLRSV